ncbi:flagellar basal body rod protein FlgC [bacterium]|jgi:flagellar basal-body rod protein FlgC|nr:flagellar basal body rod protein FlgC [bacterium]
MNFFNSFDVAASGMTAQRKMMDVTAANIANVNTTETADGTPFRRMVAVVTQKQVGDWNEEFQACSFDDAPQTQGVEVSSVQADNSDFRWVYDPSNPKAQKEGEHKGYVAMPNVNVISEMTNMMMASRAFEANATILEASKSMASKALEIGK